MHFFLDTVLFRFLPWNTKLLPSLHAAFDIIMPACSVAQSCPWLSLCDPVACSPPSSSVHGVFQARILEWVAFPLLGIFPPLVSPTLQADSLPSGPPGKPKNTEVGSLSLLQRMFPTQESNQGLLHCRQILYQLSL